MKRFLARSVFAVSIIHASQALSQVVSLEEAKKLAINYNHGLAAVRHENKESQSRIKGHEANFLPSVGIAAGVEAKRDIPAGDIAFGYLYGTYNIFNGYRDAINSDILSNETKEIQSRLQAAEFVVELEVEEWFKTYLFKEAYIKLKNETLQRNEEHKRLVGLSRKKGLLSDTDVMEFRLQEAKLKSDLIALNQELTDALSNLKSLLGEKASADIKISGKIAHQHIYESLEEVIGKVSSTNHEIKKKSIDLETAKLDRQISDNRWMPIVDFEARTGILPPSEREEGNLLDAHILLSAKMNLYSGGEIRHDQFAKAEKQLRLEAELMDQKTRLARAIEIAYRSLKVIESRSDLEKGNADFAAQYYRSVLSEYKRGFKNSPDLNAASEKLSEAQEREIDLEFSFMKQRIELERQLGRHLGARDSL